MRGRIRALLYPVGLLLAVLALAGVAAESLKTIPTAAVYPQRDFSKASRWDVVRVIGPDRLIIKNASEQRTVRLLGVAEPETELLDATSADYSQTVEFLHNLLAGEQVFVLEGFRNAPAGGELKPVRIFRAPDGLYVNLELIRQGYAGFSPAGLADELQLFGSYQERAKQIGKGLWNKSLVSAPAVKEPRGATVYVTKTGQKYHRQDCRFLSRSKISLGLDEAKKRGFTPCRACKPPE